MRRFLVWDLLAPLGLVVLVVSQALVRAGRTLPGGREDVYLGFGLALVLAHLVWRGPDLVEWIGRRQMKYGAHMLVLGLALLAILAAVNYIAFRRSVRVDLTKGQRYSLAEQTRKIVTGLKDEVRLVYFQRSAEMGAGADRLRDIERLAPQKLKVEFVDPFQSPGRARELEVRGPWPIVVVERGARRERVGNDSEQDVVNAIVKVTRETRKTVCFVEGEGERDVDDTGERGLSAAKAAIGRSQYETRKVLLAREGKVPADCTVLVLAAPEKDLLPHVADAVRGYVRGGGRALVMAEPPLQGPLAGFEALLADWNVQAGVDVVVDVSGMGQIFGASELTPISISYPFHEITKDMRGLMTGFHTARSLQAGTAAPEGVVAQNLVETSQASWAETDLTLKGRIEMDPGKDRQGPIALAAVVTVKAQPAASPSPAPSPGPGASPAPAEEAKAPEGRVVAFGDVDFATNAMLGFQANQDLFLNVVAWLAADPDLISIRPREPDDQRMFLTRTQQQNVIILALLLLPGLWAVLGIVTWWRRR